MKKIERISTLMRYINNRAQFTISEIMEEFNISRSTAIRDIREIEAIGLPLVAEIARTGGYSVMKNAVLPAMQFTDESTYNVELVLGSKAMNQFRKYHPIKAKVFYTNPFQVSGICRFNVDITSTVAIEEIVHWLLFLGNDIEIQKIPNEVKDHLKSTHLLSKISQRLI